MVFGFVTSWAVSAALLLPGTPDHFESYAKAYYRAQESHRPILVLLNPHQSERRISLGDLTKDTEVADRLKNYVVAVVADDTEKGQRVHRSFSVSASPLLVIIDRDQKYQVFRTTEELSPASLANVLRQYSTESTESQIVQDQPVVIESQPVLQSSGTVFDSFSPLVSPTVPNGYCPSCQRGGIRLSY